jgi:hypothetical protein
MAAKMLYSVVARSAAMVRRMENGRAVDSLAALREAPAHLSFYARRPYPPTAWQVSPCQEPKFGTWPTDTDPRVSTAGRPGYLSDASRNCPAYHAGSSVQARLNHARVGIYRQYGRSGRGAGSGKFAMSNATRGGR